jgi:hypothetical protein
MKKMLFITMVLLYSSVAYSQIEIKGYHIGKTIKVNSPLSYCEVETSIMGQNVNLYLKGKSQTPSMVPSLDRSATLTVEYSMKIEEISFSLNEQNAITLIDALHNRYGGEIKKEGFTTTLTTLDSKVKCHGMLDNYSITVTKYKQTDNNDF